MYIALTQKVSKVNTKDLYQVLEIDSSFNILSDQENRKNLKDVPVSKKPQFHINFDQEIKQWVENQINQTILV